MGTEKTCGCVFDERTGELNECELHSAIRRERDTWMARYVEAGEETDGLRRERDIALADLAYLHTAFEDWKVFHSTSRLEAEHAAERYKLRQERDEWLDRCTDAQASAEIARRARDNAEKERDDAIRTAQDNAEEAEKLKADLAAVLALLQECERRAENGTRSEWDDYLRRVDAALAGEKKDESPENDA